VVTRPADGQVAAARVIEKLGGEAVACPTVSVEPAGDPELLRRVAARLDRFDWLLLTSARAVEALIGAGAGDRGGGRVRIAVVGEATARAVGQVGWPIDFMPSEPRGAVLARELMRASLRPGSTVLLPRSDRALPDLPEILRRAGVRLTQVEAYRTCPQPLSSAKLQSLGRVDAFLLAAPSAVHGLVGSVGAEGVRGLHPRARFVAIGPTTASALRDCALPVDGQAPRTSFTALAQAALALCREG
jgi:uroporphyrinogen-III synthase